MKLDAVLKKTLQIVISESGMKNDVLTVTENGTYLAAVSTFTRFVNTFGDIQRCLPGSVVGIPCFLCEYHDNQFGYVETVTPSAI